MVGFQLADLDWGVADQLSGSCRNCRADYGRQCDRKTFQGVDCIYSTSPGR